MSWNWFCNASNNSVPSNELTGLELLYNATFGRNWSWSSPNGHWNFTLPTVNPCLEQWEGVVCSFDCSENISSTCVIMELNLTNMNLVGTIPVQLPILLPELEELILSNNALLTGFIPTSLGFLCNLTILDLSYNKLSGVIPSQIDTLTNLQEIYLNNNCLTDFIPTNIGLMSNITIISLSFNSLSHAIPAEIYLLTKLQSFLANNNRLSGGIPSEIGNCSYLLSF